MKSLKPFLTSVCLTTIILFSFTPVGMMVHRDPEYGDID